MNKINSISKHIGILCAMPEEVGSTLDNLKNIETKTYGDLKIHSGDWCFDNSSSKSFKIHLSIAWSGWGKVSAARAATRLISHQFNNVKVDAIFFTGVAGAVNSKLKQWDIIIPYELIQHDMDARPLFKKHEIPALKTVRIKSNKSINEWTLSTLKNSIKDGSLKNFGNIYEGLIATGDKFISNKKDIENILKEMEDLSAVEMEGASVAQVARQEEIPFQIIRVISDEANENSSEDFSKFITKYNNHSAKLISALIENIETLPI
jgi:adenosylhomocysteine nucleosidase